MARVLMLLPVRDFDPSEAAVSWQVLSNAGHFVTFATPDGVADTNDARAAFVVRDRNYVSARSPGDVHAFAKTFAGLLK